MNEAELQEEARAALGTSELVPLQQGGQKEVFTATLENVPVVVKLVRLPPGLDASEALERAHREVELLASVESDHVVRVLSEAVELGERPEAVCWVEEQLDGEDLAKLVPTFPWTSDEVWSMLRDVAVGLKACHELEVVHRDLSPGNVRRRANKKFVLIDPGFARHLKRSTLTGLFQPGTPGYLSPEHIPGGKPTPASDVFGVGILAYQALTGELPIVFTGDVGAYYDALRACQIEPVSSRGSVSIRPELADVVDRCLIRQPARRFLDAEELLSAVLSVEQDSDGDKQ